jgi:hypothetical protein
MTVAKENAVADLLRALTVASFIFVQMTGQVWLLYLLTVVQFSLSALFAPTHSAVIPNLVAEKDLVTANALDGFTWSTMLAIGALLGGIIASVLPPSAGDARYRSCITAGRSVTSACRARPVAARPAENMSSEASTGRKAAATSGSRPSAVPERSRAESLANIPASRCQSSVEAAPRQCQIVPSTVVTVTSALNPLSEPLPPSNERLALSSLIGTLVTSGPTRKQRLSRRTRRCSALRRATSG